MTTDNPKAKTTETDSKEQDCNDGADAAEAGRHEGHEYPLRDACEPSARINQLVKELSSLLVEIAEETPIGITESQWIEVVLATASTVGVGPEECQVGVIERQIQAAVKRDVSLTKITDVPGIFCSERRQYQAPVFESGQKPVQAARLCDELGLEFSDAAAAIVEADGAPAALPFERGTRWLPAVRDEIEKKLDRALSAATRAPIAREASPQGPEGRGGGREEPPSDRDAGGAPNGCDIRQSQNASNDRSERSDGENGAGSELSKRKASERSERGAGSERTKRARYTPDRERWKMRGTRNQRRFLDERVRTVAERLLFLLLLAYARRPNYAADEREGMDWVGVSAEVLEKQMGAPYHSTREVWEGSALIEVYDDGYYEAPDEDGSGGVSRRFRIPQPVLTRWAELGDGSRRWWLQTAQPRRTAQPSPMTTDLSDENNHAYPPLIDGALRVLMEADHRIRIRPIKEAIEALAHKESKTARAQRAGLQLKLKTIERQAKEIEDGLATLQNAYTPTFGGRIVFKNGGPQGMLGAVKARAYNIDGLTNYDIKSCHTTGLKEVVDKLAAVGVEIDISPWQNYDGKYEVARRTQVPLTLVKITEHAIKYGAYLPPSLAQAHAVFEGTSVDPETDLGLVKAAKKYADDPNAALAKLHEVFAGMRRVVKDISQALLNDFWEAHKQPGGPAGTCVKNACGIPFRPYHYEEGHERETKAMAWMLQGLEAAFCHSITILSTDYDYAVVANEHDGLIVDGTIHEMAIQEAREMSGFDRAEMVQKPHADEDEIAEMYGTDDQDDTDEALSGFELAQERAAEYQANRKIPQLTAEDVERMRSPREPFTPDRRVIDDEPRMNDYTQHT